MMTGSVVGSQRLLVAGFLQSLDKSIWTLDSYVYIQLFIFTASILTLYVLKSVFVKVSIRSPYLNEIATGPEKRAANKCVNKLRWYARF